MFVIRGFGLTLILKLIAGPGHELAVGVIWMLAVLIKSVVLTEVKAAILPFPELPLRPTISPVLTQA